MHASIISSQQLFEQLERQQQNHPTETRLIVIDLSQSLLYETAHIPSSVHIDRQMLMNFPWPKNGHLPPIQLVSQILNQAILKSINDASISSDTKFDIVAYDDVGGIWASRFLWILESLDQISGPFQLASCSLLNGGLFHWLYLKLPIERGLDSRFKKVERDNPAQGDPFAQATNKNGQRQSQITHQFRYLVEESELQEALGKRELVSNSLESIGSNNEAMVILDVHASSMAKCLNYELPTLDNALAFPWREWLSIEDHWTFKDKGQIFALLEKRGVLPINWVESQQMIHICSHANVSSCLGLIFLRSLGFNCELLPGGRMEWAGQQFPPSQYA